MYARERKINDKIKSLLLFTETNSVYNLPSLLHFSTTTS